jgi:hypothetical protein
MSETGYRFTPVIEAEEPPQTAIAGGKKFSAETVALFKHISEAVAQADDGQWLLVATTEKKNDASAFQSAISRGYKKAAEGGHPYLQHGTWRAAARSTPDGAGKLYVQFSRNGAGS